jgi:hypothetical protein
MRGKLEVKYTLPHKRCDQRRAAEALLSQRI